MTQRTIEATRSQPRHLINLAFILTNLGKFIKMHRQQLPDTNFAEPPEILPGRSLRLNVHADGQGYDLLLRDLTDKKCGYASGTDENAVIWQSKWIDCEI